MKDKPVLCPCGQGKAYAACCGKYHSGEGIAPDPESLMRSRYSAYVLTDLDYIESTMAGPAAQDFDREAVKRGALSVHWLGLKVLSAKGDAVEFAAFFEDEGKRAILHELSQFQRINDRWFYLKGKPIRTKSNDPCLCGSKKKYKRCCGGSIDCVIG